MKKKTSTVKKVNVVTESPAMTAVLMLEKRTETAAKRAKAATIKRILTKLKDMAPRQVESIEKVMIGMTAR